MFCSHCGKKLIENAKFCGNCGHKVLVPEISTPKTDTGEVARKIKKELSNMPLITLISEMYLVEKTSPIIPVKW